MADIETVNFLFERLEQAQKDLHAISNVVEAMFPLVDATHSLILQLESFDSYSSQFGGPRANKEPIEEAKKTLENVKKALEEL